MILVAVSQPPAGDEADHAALLPAPDVGGPDAAALPVLHRVDHGDQPGVSTSMRTSDVRVLYQRSIDRSSIFGLRLFVGT